MTSRLVPIRWVDLLEASTGSRTRE
ncbi:unnamed protein product, partial [Tilletia caries]